MRNSILFFTFLFPTFTVFAQRYEILALAGVNGSVIKEAGANNSFTRRYAPHVGFLAGVGSEAVMFETGLLYSSKGTKIDVNTSFTFPPPFPASFTQIELNYLEVPFMAVISPQSFRFFMGPQVSFLTSAYADKQNVKSAFHNTSWSLRYGIGYNRGDILLQLHLINGITDIYKDQGAKLVWKNNSFQLSLGYRFLNRNKPSVKSQRKKEKDGIPDHRVIE
jgi:hypothetical protein